MTRLTEAQRSLPSAEALSLWLTLQRDSVTESLARLGDGTDLEALHDARVALRRLDTGLRALGGYLGLRPRWARRLRQIAQASNRARDTEVQLAWLENQKTVAAVERAGKRWITQHLTALESDADKNRADLPVAWQAWVEPFTRRWAKAVASLPETQNLSLLTAEIIAAQLAELLHRLQLTAPLPEGGEVHRIRIAAKRLRYSVESFADGCPEAEILVRELKALQALTGDLHDRQVLLATLATAVGTAGKEFARMLYQLRLAQPTRAALRAAQWQNPVPGLCTLGFRAQQQQTGYLDTFKARYLGPAWGETFAAAGAALVAALTAQAAQTPAALLAKSP